MSSAQSPSHTPRESEACPSLDLERQQKEHGCPSRGVGGPKHRTKGTDAGSSQPLTLPDGKPRVSPGREVEGRDHPTQEHPGLAALESQSSWGVEGQYHKDGGRQSTATFR